MSNFSGMRPKPTASSELMIVSRSRGQALISIGAEPVAITIAGAVYSSVEPSRFLSATVVAFVNVASP